jgi:quercetin dioxygenase-like cupin family protein
MPFYDVNEMPGEFVEVGHATMKTVAGEFIKAGVVSYEAGDGPPPHFHPNEEPFIFMLEGKMGMVLGDETKTVGKWAFIHIPRNMVHSIDIVEGPAVFFTAKSPVGDGDLNQDYNRTPGAEVIQEKLETG